MTVSRFRNRVFESPSGTDSRCSGGAPVAVQVIADFLVPGTDRNQPESNGSRFFPSLDGNRDQDHIWSMVR